MAPATSEAASPIGIANVRILSLRDLAKKYANLSVRIAPKSEVQTPHDLQFNGARVFIDFNSGTRSLLSVELPSR